VVEGMNATFRLLLVDDDDEFLEILERRFSRGGFTVTACANFADALEAAGKQRFDAAIVDRAVPGGSDLELVAKLKAIDADLPIIVLSGSVGPGFVAEAKSAGACDYLTKPCRLDEIEAALNRALPSHDVELPIGEATRRR